MNLIDYTEKGKHGIFLVCNYIFSVIKVDILVLTQEVIMTLCLLIPSKTQSQTFSALDKILIGIHKNTSPPR